MWSKGKGLRDGLGLVQLYSMLSHSLGRTCMLTSIGGNEKRDGGRERKREGVGRRKRERERGGGGRKRDRDNETERGEISYG